MSCSYYEFRSNDYYCTLKHGYVNSDVYYKYCRNYDYAQCPIYKDHEALDRTCYLTTACTYFKGLPDDCYELQTLREYRDTWLVGRQDGKEIIDEYYRIAPMIISEINDVENDKIKIYEQIYNHLVAPCVEMIEQKKYEEALCFYMKKTKELQVRYLSGLKEK